MTTDEKNLFQAQTLIEEFRRHGVTRFVVCPGSRSSPLALAMAMADNVEGVVHHDERGAGYYAVGYARATGRAAAVVTTSGTAAVNLHPAIVEASHDNLPLIALTADRPPELHGRGANQTIEQRNLFSDRARFVADLPCPDECNPAELLGAIDQSCRHISTRWASPGPVHLNCRYSEALVPPPDRLTPYRQIVERIYPELKPWADSASPFRIDPAPTAEPEVAVVDETAHTIRDARCGLLLVGHLGSETEQQAVLDLIGKLGWPVIADITSGLCAAQQTLLVRHADPILASEKFAGGQPPDTVLHVGGRLTSKRLLQFIEKSSSTNYLFNAGAGIVYDPVGAVTQRTEYNTVAFCRALTEQLTGGKQNQVWNDIWRSATRKSAQIVADMCGEMKRLTEPVLAYSLSRMLPDQPGLFLASSMPIRDMDMFATLQRALRVAANRGASGIDGTIASACGYAEGLGLPVTLLIGDQAFLHDLSSLPLLASTRRPVTLVVVNNWGGRIFEQLPVAAHREALDRYFVAAHELTFEKIAETFGLEYTRVTDRDFFSQAYANASDSGRSAIVEASVDPAASREHRSSIINEVRAALDSQ